MLVGLKEILKIAEERKCAIGSFNTPNMATLKAVIAAAEEKNEPVIIMHAQLHEEMGICKLDEIGPVMLLFAEKAKVPVCVHLDHGEDLEYIKKGLELGFPSVMYDGGTLPNEINYANTAAVVEMAKKFGASVEAEIGSMGARESGGEGGDSIYTEPKDAEKFARVTGIDALACAFGTAHGIYTVEPKLDFERVGKIKELVTVPLVMHGGSGVSHEDYRRLIGLGIRKVNYYTYMAKAGVNAVKMMGETTYYHDIENEAIKAMKNDAMRAIEIFSEKSF